MRRREGRASAAGALVFVLIFMVAACATEPLQPGAPVVTRKAIAPYATHEECAKMDADDRIDYRFEAQRPVAFNIHYREANVVIMPVSVDNVTTDSGIFRALIAQDYCLTWEAGREGAILDYRILFVRGRH